jgi:rRNA processing protein Krr1/Pno1
MKCGREVIEDLHNNVVPTTMVLYIVRKNEEVGKKQETKQSRANGGED